MLRTFGSGTGGENRRVPGTGEREVVGGEPVVVSLVSSHGSARLFTAALNGSILGVVVGGRRIFLVLDLGMGYGLETYW